MIPVTTFAGKKVAIFGLGGSGLATAGALIAGGAQIVAWDDNPDRVAQAAGKGIPAADLRALDWSTVAALVLAPGVPLTHPAPHWSVGLARAAAVEVIGDIELFCRERRAHAPDAPFVAVTGTNGKSTTTALIAHICAKAGFDTQLGGNIGTAILSLQPPRAGRVHVIECSSFQIDLAPGIDPTVGILINLTEDHLDRHGTMDNYAAVRNGSFPASARKVPLSSVSMTTAARPSPTVPPRAAVASSAFRSASRWLTASMWSASASSKRPAAPPRKSPS